MAGLARKLNLWNYFALGFGTMIGTGWVILMDDWLERGGPLGAMIGFLIGGIFLLPIGYVYGQWVRRLPDAAGEAAYTAQVFPPFVSYLTGWMMLLAYFIVCPWEAVVLGKLAAYIFPRLDTMELYRVAGQPVFLPRLLVGIGLTVFLAYLNYRGIRASALFQNWATSSVLAVFLLLLLISVHSGASVNFKPVFSHTPLVSILLTLQIVPYFVTGFESVPKVAEEAHPGFPPGNFFKAIAMALLVGAGFYVGLSRCPKLRRRHIRVSRPVIFSRPSRWRCWWALDFTCWLWERFPILRRGRGCWARDLPPRLRSSRERILCGWCG